jgi:hypothetical protein
MNITITLNSVRAESGGIPRLIFNFLAKNTSDLNLGIANVNAEIRVTPSLSGDDISKSYFIGYAVMESQIGQFSKYTEQSWRLSLPLYPYTLQKMEEMRKGGDLFLTALFFCAAVSMLDGASPLTGLGRASVQTPGYSSNYCPFKVAQSDWVKTLRDLGYGDYFLMEIPLRGVPPRRGMEKAVVHLRSAWENFEEGKDDQTLVSCYKAFEYLAKRKGAKHPDQQGFLKLLENLDDEGKKTPLKMLMHNLCTFLTLGRHEQGKEAVAIDGADSEFALILTQAALGYLAKRMK